MGYVMRIRTVNFIQDRGLNYGKFESLLPDQNHLPWHVVQFDERQVIDKLPVKISNR